MANEFKMMGKFFPGEMSISQGPDKSYFMYFNEVFETSRSFTNAIGILLSAAKGDTVTILANTPGGNVNALKTLLSAVHACKATTVLKVNGISASCGAVLACHVDKLEMGDHAQIMFHGSSSMRMGNTQAMAEESMATVSMMKELCQPALDKGMLTQEEWDNAFDKKCDIYLSKQKLQERGVVQ